MPISTEPNRVVIRRLIREVMNGNARKYVTLTDKGFRYLEKYRQIRGFIDEFEL